MSNLRMIIENAHDDAMLTATSEALPVAFTQRSGRSYVWRSTSLDEQVITASFSEPRFLSAMVLYNHNLTSEGTIRVEYLLEGETVYDSGTIIAADIIPLGVWRAGIDPWGAQDVTELPIAQYNVWTESTLVDGYRITLNDANHPDGYLQIARIITGVAYSPRFNASYGVELEWVDFAENTRTESGSLRTIGEGMARRLTFDLSHLSGAGLGELSREMLKARKRQDIYVSLYPEAGSIKEAEHAFVARRDNNYGHTHDRARNWQNQMVLEEV